MRITLLSKLFNPILKKLPNENKYVSKSHKLLLYCNLISPSSFGTYTIMPILQRSLDKLIMLINNEMNSIDAQKITMPSLGRSSIWKQSGRWDLLGDELYKFIDRDSKEMCLQPTHEEEVTSLLATFQPLSLRQMPILFYQITPKFRNEVAPKYGLLRGREFLMKDLYSFDCDEASAMLTYRRVIQQYHHIFQQLDVEFICVDADSGGMGGSLSHEFHIPMSSGEDTVLICNKCHKGLNAELKKKGNLSNCCNDSSCSGSFESTQTVEIGHCFMLGDRYTKAFDLHYHDLNQEKRHAIMGCYGIGVTRLLSACIESLSDDNNIKWPQKIAPFRVSVLLQKNGAHDYPPEELKAKILNSLVENFRNNSLCPSDILLDDSDYTIGRKLSNCSAIGIPWAIIVKNSEVLETVDIYGKKKYFLPIEDAISVINGNYKRSLDNSITSVEN